MGFLKKLFSPSSAGKDFNYALILYGRLRQYPIGSSSYHQALMEIIGILQDVLAKNNRDGDAHVLLANTYQLLHVDVFLDSDLSYPRKLAAALIQHWIDEPMRQYPWTKNIDNGYQIYDQVSGAKVFDDRFPVYRIGKKEMVQLKQQYYRDALQHKTLSELIDNN